MPFPIVEYPIYETKLPSNNKKIKFRPYKTVHEKLLLGAVAGELDSRAIELALKQTVAYCVLEDKFDVDQLPIFDLVYLWLQARAKSVGEDMTVYFQGHQDSECEECRKPKKATIKLSDVKVIKHPEHKQEIRLSKDVGIMMKYPTVEMLPELDQMDREQDQVKILATIAKCIEYVYDKDSVFYVADQTPEEVIAWLDNLTPNHFRDVLMFFETMPKVSHEIEIVCPKCGGKSWFNMEKVESFFG